MKLRLLLRLLILLAGFSTARAALPAHDTSDALCDTAVYFINIGAGGEIYELDGHSAIAVVLPDGRGAAYNYGVFDFASPNFVWRFVKGETDYMTVAVPLGWFLDSYAGSGRRVEAARLNLDSDQTSALMAVLQHDIRPEYRTYRYNYVLDNCATRPLQAIERAVGDSIILGPAPFESQPLMPMTFRNIMRAHHTNYPWYQFGIDLALGSGIDRPITRREASFAPVELMGMLPAATAAGKPLVAESVTLQPEDSATATAGPTPWVFTPFAVGCYVFAAALWFSYRDRRRQRTTRWFDSAFFGILGLAGVLLTFLIFVSVHEATSPNWQYVWLNPLCLIPAVCIWIKRAKKVVMWYFFLNFVAVLALIVCWYWIPQSGNAAFAPLIGADLLRSACYLYVNRNRENKQ